MKLRAPLEDLKKSRRRPAAALLRLATLLDFRPSFKVQGQILDNAEFEETTHAHHAGSPELPDGPGGRWPLRGVQCRQPPRRSGFGGRRVEFALTETVNIIGVV